MSIFRGMRRPRSRKKKRKSPFIINAKVKSRRLT